jgi:hypothetical protein
LLSYLHSGVALLIPLSLASCSYDFTPVAIGFFQRYQSGSHNWRYFPALSPVVCQFAAHLGRPETAEVVSDPLLCFSVVVPRPQIQRDLVGHFHQVIDLPRHSTQYSATMRWALV